MGKLFFATLLHLNFCSLYLQQYCKMIRKLTFTGIIDGVGIWASLLCAVHCAALPILLTITLFSGLEFLEDESIEAGVLAFSASIAFLSLVPTYVRRKDHRPLLWALSGFLVIGTGRWIELHYAEHLATALGALLVARAHWMNRKCRKPAVVDCYLPNEKNIRKHSIPK
jgi:hypothetical protein